MRADHDYDKPCARDLDASTCTYVSERHCSIVLNIRNMEEVIKCKGKRGLCNDKSRTLGNKLQRFLLLIIISYLFVPNVKMLFIKPGQKIIACS